VARIQQAACVRNVRASIVRGPVHDVCARRLQRARQHARQIVIVSPWITLGAETVDAVQAIGALATKDRIPTYIITRPPTQASHERAMQFLQSCPMIEVVYNRSVHAKVIACLAPYPYGFALLGSANLTANSAGLYEVALLVLAVGAGETIVKDLAAFGMDYLRTRPESQVVKRIAPRR